MYTLIFILSFNSSHAKSHNNAVDRAFLFSSEYCSFPSAASSVARSSYWNTDSASASFLGSGLSTANLKIQTNLVNWDFDSTWALSPFLNSGLPYFRPFLVNQPVLAAITVDSNASCSSSSNGGLTVVAADGLPPYSYLWSNGDTSATITDLAVGVYTVTVTDSVGDTAVASAQIIAVDTISPFFISCPADIIIDPDSTGCNAIVNYPIPVFSDNCSANITQIAGLASDSSFPAGVTTNTFVVTDVGGNTDTCSFTVTVRDTVNPTVSCSIGDTTIGSDLGDCEAVFKFPFPQASDNCNTTTAKRVSQTIDFVNTSVDYTGNLSGHARVYDLAEEGIENDYLINNIIVGINQGKLNAVITVNIYLETEMPAPVTAFSAPISRIVKPFVTTTDTIKTSAWNRLEYVPLNLRLPAGTKFIVEVIAPFDADFLIGGNKEKDLETAPGYLASFSNSYRPYGFDTAPVIALDGEEYDGLKTVLTSGLPSGSSFPIGTTTNTYTVYDSNGNTDSCSFNVLVQDVQAPRVFGSNSVVTTDSAACSAVVNYSSIGASDNCGIDTVYQIGGLPSGSVFPFGVTTNTFVSVDVHGNPDTASFTVTVNDEEGPVALLNNRTIAYLDSSGQVTVRTTDIDSASFDACGIIDSIVLSQSQFDCNSVGSFNATGPTLSYINFDGLDDKVIIPASPELDFTTGTIEMWVRVDTPATPGFSSALLAMRSDTNTRWSISVGPTVTFFWDGSNFKFGGFSPGYGNWHHLAVVFNSSQLMVYMDGILRGNTPFLMDTTAIGNSLVLGSGSPFFAASEFFAGQVDELRVWDTVRTQQQIMAGLNTTLNGDEDGLLAYYSMNEGSGLVLNDLSSNNRNGTLTNMDSDSAWTGVANQISVQLTDSLGNVSSVTTNLIIQDTIAPSIQSRDTLIVLDSNGLMTIDTSYVISSITEACEVDTIFLDTNAFSCNDLGANTNTITAIDIHGNISTATATLTVIDTIKPVVVTRSISVFLDSTGTIAVTAVQLDSGSTDICGIDSLYLSQSIFNCSDVGQNSVYLIAKDANGNIDSALAMVEVSSEHFFFIDSVSVVDVSCKNGSDGSANVFISGGQAPYSFAWDNGTNLYNDNNTLPAGTFTLTVTDSNGCTTGQTNIEVSEPQILRGGSIN